MSTPRPGSDEVLGYLRTLSNAGRWGDDDERGTLNLITESKVRAATALVRTGRVVSLSADLDPDDADPLGLGTEISLTPTTYAIGPVLAARETLTMTTHGSPTHLDAPSHMAWEGRWYNGFDTGERHAQGTPARATIAAARAGITTRGVLLDVAAARGVPWLAPGDGAFPEDLDAAERRQGVRVEAGDVLIVRTGFLERGGHADLTASGYHASCLPWLHERGVAVIASDGLNDINPSGYGPPRPATPADYAALSRDELRLLYPIHAIGLTAMGAWLLDNVIVAELRDVCEELGRWEFLLSVAPPRLVGATGFPVNPIAVF